MAVDCDVLAIELQLSTSMRHALEKATVEVLSSSVRNPFAFLAFALPAPEIVLLSAHVFHQPLALEELQKASITSMSTFFLLESFNLSKELWISVGKFLTTVVLLIVGLFESSDDLAGPVDLVANLKRASHILKIIR